MLATTVVGSYPQPDWLVDRSRLLEKRVPRVRETSIWRVPRADATIVAIRGSIPASSPTSPARP